MTKADFSASLLHSFPSEKESWKKDNKSALQKTLECNNKCSQINAVLMTISDFLQQQKK